MKTKDLNVWPCDQIATLMFCINGDHVLLIHKKRGLGAGKINGPGGKLDPDESLAECACRETLEETGIITCEPRAAGILCFTFTDGLRLRVHPFVTRNFRGVLQETDEALPFWQEITHIPYDRMWSDDALWLPHVLSGGSVFGQFLFDGDNLIEHKLALN